MASHKVLILADGLFPQKESVLKLIREAKAVVCCDGAAQKAIAFGRVPDYVVGDLDSITPELKMLWPDRMVHVPDQNSNDLTKAVRFCLSKGWKKLVIIGATGLREDHTLANISLLHQYLPICESVEMVSDYGRFTAIDKTTEFTSFPKQQVSIFSLTPETPLTFHGLRYTVENYKLESWWQGTLNESVGDTFSIELNAPGRIIVYRVF